LKIFSKLYTHVMQWSRHPNAKGYLAALSFSESSFFPIPPDVMLAPMSLAKPKEAWRLALITTVASVLGGLFGYLIGSFAMEAVEPWITELGYQDKYLQARSWFEEWGFWAIFLAGFSPIPYKIFTITAGAISMALLPFILASIIGRGARFYLVAGLMAWGGEEMEKKLHRYVDLLGWLTILAVVAFVFYSRH